MFAEAAGAPKMVPLVALQAGHTQLCNSFNEFFTNQEGGFVKKAAHRHLSVRSILNPRIATKRVGTPI